MSDKVQLIKEWVENLKNESPTIPDLGINALAGFQLACDDVIAFINSLPEEPKKQPKYKSGDTIKGPCNNIFQVKEVLDRQYVLHSENGDELNSIELVDKSSCIVEEPVSKDRINECLNWDKDWGCSTSPMNNCDSCPQAKWVEVKEEKENYNERYKRIAQTEQFKKSYCDKSLGKEESASEDLEEEYDNYFKKHETDIVLNQYSNCKDIARHFAEWGRNHFENKSEIASEDLEEEITKCYKSRNDLMMTRKQFGELIHHFGELIHHFTDCQRKKDQESGCEIDFTTKNQDLEEAAEAFYDNCNMPKSSWWDEGILHKMSESKETFIAGAKWQKQQMMKNAVNATILDVDAQTIEFGLWPEKLLNIKEGDKVKIIIVKDEICTGKLD